MTSRATDLDVFYQHLRELERTCGGSRRLDECDGRMGWPRRGVYFFFEPGELREDGVTPRVAHVGTHGLRPSRATLWKRLSQHKGPSGGAMSGGGNHRGSIFRLHVGRALLSREPTWSAGIRASWGVGSTADPAVREQEFPLERAVSEHIRVMPFLWLEVDDPPGPTSDRGRIKAGAIALLSNFDRPVCDGPSEGWLGNDGSPTIRESGLWNVDHVDEVPDPAFLDLLESHLKRQSP
ncbi:hypothetical protein GCM10023317_94280 [Actinopolymorpha pittospori]